MIGLAGQRTELQQLRAGCRTVRALSWQAGCPAGNDAGICMCCVSALSGLSFRCVATPCHTRGHVCFFLDADDGQAGWSCGMRWNTAFVISCQWYRKPLPGTCALFRRRSFRSRLRPVYGRCTLVRGRNFELGRSLKALRCRCAGPCMPWQRCRRIHGFSVATSTRCPVVEHGIVFLVATL